MITRSGPLSVPFLLVLQIVSAPFPSGIIRPAKNETEPLVDLCGIDNSTSSEIPEGEADLSTYPWFGVLVYPLKGELITSPVILITKQLVIGAAIEIASLPKLDFRARTKVIIGHDCSGPRIKVKDYSYHPDFRKNTFSSLVLIQLDIVKQDLRPICSPPNKIYKPDFYAVSLQEDCASSKINIFKMAHVDMAECKSFYRRSELDIDSMWPKYTVCAKTLKGGGCLWQSGVFLVVKQDNRWSLVGFGVYGPGCESPARFLDYGMYHQWVRTSIERIGRPAITRIADNEVVMRRRLSHIQRFGPCDPEEKFLEIYTDHTAIIPESSTEQVAYYNFTILAMYEYSCIVFRCSQYSNIKPKLRIRRLCLAQRPSCYQFTTLEINFEIKIDFRDSVEYHVNVYGDKLKLIDAKKMTLYANINEYRYPVSWTYIPYSY